MPYLYRLPLNGGIVANLPNGIIFTGGRAVDLNIAEIAAVLPFRFDRARDDRNEFVFFAEYADFQTVQAPLNGVGEILAGNAGPACFYIGIL